MACDHAEKVAAIASQAGATFLDASRCTPASAVNILQIHGTSDGVVSIGGGPLAGGRYPSAQATVERWAQTNGCSLQAELPDLRIDIDSSRPGAETAIRRYPGCKEGGSAELWTINGGPHAPGLVVNGRTTNLAVHTIDWLLAHPKRDAPEVSFTIAPENGVGPLEVTVDAAGSTAPEGTNITLYRWDFGDGAEAFGRVAKHSYMDPGLYAISLIVILTGRISSTSPMRATCSVFFLRAEPPPSPPSLIVALAC